MRKRCNFEHPCRERREAPEDSDDSERSAQEDVPISVLAERRRPRPAGHWTWSVDDPWSLVDCRVSIKRKFKRVERDNACTVYGYDACKGMHQCEYDNGNKREYNMARKTFRVLAKPGESYTSDSSRPPKKKQRGSSRA